MVMVVAVEEKRKDAVKQEIEVEEGEKGTKSRMASRRTKTVMWMQNVYL